MWLKLAISPIHRYVYTQICPYTYMFIHRYVYTQICPYTDMSIHRYVHTQICPYTEVHMPIHRYVYVYTYELIPAMYICIYIYNYMAN